MNSIILQRISPTEINEAARQVWSNEGTALEIAKETIAIISRSYVRKCSFFGGKSARPLVAGLFYLLSYRYGVKKNQKELADKLGTTDVSIRISYRHWLEVFPDQFSDIFCKLLQDKDLRYYLLCILKQNIQNS